MILIISFLNGKINDFRNVILEKLWVENWLFWFKKREVSRWGNGINVYR